jgi:hypothetical protein
MNMDMNTKTKVEEEVAIAIAAAPFARESTEPLLGKLGVLMR